MRYATIDTHGALTGFYDDVLHPVIPDGAVQLSDVQYEQWLLAQGAMRWTGGGLTAAPVPPPPPAPPPPTLADLQAQMSAISVQITAMQAATPAKP